MIEKNHPEKDKVERQRALIKKLRSLPREERLRLLESELAKATASPETKAFAKLLVAVKEKPGSKRKP